MAYLEYAMFEFEMTLNLVIEQILCWDEESQYSCEKPDPLGKLKGGL